MSRRKTNRTSRNGWKRERYIYAQRKKWRRDPVRFVTETLKAKPWKKQRLIVRAIAEHNRVAVKACNGSGKTFIAAHAIIWWLMVNKNAAVITTAPTDRQVRQALWREIRNICYARNDLIGARVNSNSLYIDHRRYAFGFSTNRESRFHGFHHPNILVVIDDASNVKTEIIQAANAATCSKNAKMLMIGTPTSTNGAFFDAFHRERKHWKNIGISAFETPDLQRPAREPNIPGLVTKAWVQQARRTWGENSPTYQARVLGQFPESDGKILEPSTAQKRRAKTLSTESVNDARMVRSADEDSCRRYGKSSVANLGNKTECNAETTQETVKSTATESKVELTNNDGRASKATLSNHQPKAGAKNKQDKTKPP